MALQTTHQDIAFGVGDIVRVHQSVIEAGKKTRTQIFEGTVIRIKGREEGKTVTVRKIGSQKVGIELIFPLTGPTIQKVEVVKRGMEGVHQAKLYFIRGKSRRDIDKIYSRTNRKGREQVKKTATKKATPKKKSSPKVSKKK